MMPKKSRYEVRFYVDAEVYGILSARAKLRNETHHAYAREMLVSALGDERDTLREALELLAIRTDHAVRGIEETKKKVDEFRQAVRVDMQALVEALRKAR